MGQSTHFKVKSGSRMEVNTVERSQSKDSGQLVSLGQFSLREASGICWGPNRVT